MLTRWEAVTGGVLQEKLFLKFRKICMETPVLKSLFNKVTDTHLATLLERESNTSVFLWISQKKKLRTPDDCFWKTSYLNWYVKLLFMAGVLFSIQYIKKIRTKFRFLGSVKSIFSVVLFPDIGWIINLFPQLSKKRDNILFCPGILQFFGLLI